MLLALFGRGDFLYLFEETVIGEKNARGFPKVEKMDNDRNGKRKQSPEKGRI